MPRKLDPMIASVLTNHGFGAEAAWDCHGVWVVYHRILEQIAAKAEIRFDAPLPLETNGQAKSVAICVTGHLNDRSEWSIGEAAPGNNKNAYPYAMAEKRAKDRVILKLIGLHGLAYSEDEADDFKDGGAPKTQPPATTKTPPKTPKSDDVDRKQAAANWCYERKAELPAIATDSDLSAWHKRHSNAIAKAEKVAPDAHKLLLEALSERSKQLSPMAA